MQVWIWKPQRQVLNSNTTSIMIGILREVISSKEQIDRFIPSLIRLQIMSVVTNLSSLCRRRQDDLKCRVGWDNSIPMWKPLDLIMPSVWVEMVMNGVSSPTASLLHQQSLEHPISIIHWSLENRVILVTHWIVINQVYTI